MHMHNIYVYICVYIYISIYANLYIFEKKSTPPSFSHQHFSSQRHLTRTILDLWLTFHQTFLQQGDSQLPFSRFSTGVDNGSKGDTILGVWTNHLKKIEMVKLVKSSPKFRGENQKSNWNHHLVSNCTLPSRIRSNNFKAEVHAASQAPQKKTSKNHNAPEGHS